MVLKCSCLELQKSRVSWYGKPHGQGLATIQSRPGLENWYKLLTVAHRSLWTFVKLCNMLTPSLTENKSLN